MVRVKAAGGAMGLFNFNRPRWRPFEICSAMASWRAYEKVQDDDSLRKLAEQDLRDSHAMALHSTIGEMTGFLDGCAVVWDNGLFNLVALLYLSRCLRSDKDCWKHLGAGIPDKHLSAFADFGLDLATKLDKLPSRDGLTHSLDKLYADREQILDDMLHSDYVFIMPPRDRGAARSRLLCSIRDKALHDDIASIYLSQLEDVEWDARWYTKHVMRDFASMHGFPYHPHILEEWCRYGLLTVSQGLKLVQAVENNKLVEALITLRPPNSLASHFLSMVDCAEHARLLLAGSELPVYYTFPELKYSNLLTASKQDSCVEVLKSPLGFAARGPSPIEKTLRRLALEATASYGGNRMVNESFFTAPPGMEFGKLNSVPVGPEDPKDSKTRDRFAKTVNVFRTIATCEPSVEKLSYLVGGQAANACHSMFVDVARDTKVINWPALVDAAEDDHIVYDRWSWGHDHDGRRQLRLGIDSSD